MTTTKEYALETLDAQLEIVKYFNTEEGVDYLRGFVRSMVDKDHLYVPGASGDGLEEFGVRSPKIQYADALGENIADSIARHLNSCETYYVTEDMMGLMMHAGESVPHTPFEPDDPPTPSGFVLLPHPVVTRDVHDLRISARAFAWWPTMVTVKNELNPAFDTTQQAIMFCMWTNKNDYEYDDYCKQAHERPQEFMRLPRYGVVHWQPVEWGSDWYRDPGMGRDMMTTELGFSNVMDWLAFLKTFFLLVKQRVVTMERGYNRGASRAWKRAGLILPEDSAVQVITLRKSRPLSEHEIDGEGEKREYSHRFVVGGHWRNQWYPSKQRHEPVYIYEYIKGPEDKPIVYKDKVFVWKR